MATETVLPEDMLKLQELFEDYGDTANLRKFNEARAKAMTDDQLRYEFLRRHLNADNEGTLQLPLDTTAFAYPVAKAGPRREDAIKIPTAAGILKTLGFEDTKDKDGNVVKTAQDNFIDAYADHPKALTEDLAEKDKSIGSHSKEILKQVFKEVSTDRMNQKIQEARDSVLSGNYAYEPKLTSPSTWIPPKAQSILMDLFMDKQKDAYRRGEDPSWGDYAADIGGNALMWVPGTGWVSAASKLPKIGAAAMKLANVATTKAPKVAPKVIGISKSVAGNAVAPFATEGVQFVGDAIDSDRNAELNSSRAILGTLTNVGVNDVLLRAGGKLFKVGLDNKAAREASKEAREALKGATKESDKVFTQPVSQDHLQAYVVNKLGGDKAADFAATQFGVNPKTVKELRKNSKEVNDARYRKDAKLENEILLKKAMDDTDAKYLQMIVDNPFVLQSSNDTGFKMWLVTRGNDLLRGTSYHRPTWEVEY